MLHRVNPSNASIDINPSIKPPEGRYLQCETGTEGRETALPYFLKTNET